MTAFDDFGALPPAPSDAAPATQQAERLVRELRAQNRISTVEVMTIIGTLWETPVSSAPRPALPPALKAG